LGALDALAVGAAEHVEKSFGAYAGLRAYLPLATLLSKVLTPEEVTLARKATQGALRCAVKTSSLDVISELAPRWALLTGGGAPPADEVVSLVRTLDGLGPRGSRAALALAEAESRRSGDARASYAAARLEARRGRAREALTLYELAFRTASAEGRARLGWAARARAIVLASRLGASERSLELATPAIEPPPRARPEDSLAIASARLMLSGKFQRAAGLSLLAHLAKTAPPLVAKRAALVAAQHADRLGGELSAVEADRVAATLASWPVAGERARAMARLALTVRAASGGAGGSRGDALVELAKTSAELGLAVEAASEALRGALPTSTPSGPEGDVLGVAALARRAELELAAPRLLRLAAAVDAAAPATLWTAALLGLAAPDPARAAAIELAERLVARGLAPRRGWLAVAALASRGEPEPRSRELVLAALRRAALAGEPLAKQQLSTRLAYEAHEAARRSDHEGALALLDEAERASTI
jgi:hypothetical protein